MLQYLAPLAQTLLWVLLVAGIVWRFHRPLHGLLEALQRRVESGSGLKAGPFELQAPIRSQSAEEQRAKIESEVKEIRSDTAALAAPNSQDALRDIGNDYLSIEDLALRAVQAAYKVPVNRQVAMGAEAFDGVFSKYEQLYVVEIKYMPGEPKPSRIREGLEVLSKRMIDAGIRKATIVLVLVFENEEHVNGIQSILPQLTIFSAFPVDARLFSKGKLQFQFTPNVLGSR
jgi:hypothetical protein